jgi:hypothetical protein
MDELTQVPPESIGAVLIALVVWAVGPPLIVRLARMCYPPAHPHRLGRQLLDDLLARKPVDQLHWALQQLERGVLDELLPRIVATLAAAVDRARNRQ